MLKHIQHCCDIQINVNNNPIKVHTYLQKRKLPKYMHQAYILNTLALTTWREMLFRVYCIFAWGLYKLIMTLFYHVYDFYACLKFILKSGWGVGFKTYTYMRLRLSFIYDSSYIKKLQIGDRAIHYSCILHYYARRI